MNMSGGGVYKHARYLVKFWRMAQACYPLQAIEGALVQGLGVQGRIHLKDPGL